MRYMPDVFWNVELQGRGRERELDFEASLFLKVLTPHAQ